MNKPETYKELLEVLINFDCKDYNCKNCPFENDDYVCDILLEHSYNN